MRPHLAPLVLTALLVSACSKSPEAPGGSTHAAGESDRTFDAAAMLDPGTKGLVVIDGFPKRPTYWDFDRVAYGARVTHAFRMRNEEGREVTILDLLPSCGCTQASVRYTNAKGEVESGVRGGEKVLTIPKDATFEVVCELDTTTSIERMNVDKLAQVRMRTDAPRAPYITFELHVIVERAFRSVPAVIDLGEIPQSAGKARRADVSTESVEDTSRVVSIASVEGPFVATIDPTDLQGRAFWIVVAEAQKGLPLGPVRGKLVLATTRADGTTPGAPFELPITGQVVPDVVAHPALFAFGAFERDALKEVSIDLDALVPGERIAFLGAEAKGTGANKLAFDRMPIEPGAPEALAHDAANAPKWKITLKTTSDFPLGPFSGTLEIKTDHPRVPSIVVPFQGVAK
ncbi:MAG: DUF1573 domain-containing protein [Planctomycetes bacterium]|nr:DUF1573 domain-containing protein [Planctomycetota bacterium]